MEVVRDAFRGLLQSEISSTLSPRHQQVQKDLRFLLASSESEVFELFAEKLTGELAQRLPALKKGSRQSSICEQAQVAFYKSSLAELSDSWACLYFSLGLPFSDPLLSQCVNRRVFESLLQLHIQHLITSSGSNASRMEEKEMEHQQEPLKRPVLSVDEENALRFACGFIPFKLIGKHAKKKDAKSQCIVRCLKALSQKSDSELLVEEAEDYECYTTVLLQKINKGGLFQVNDAAYNLFRSVEEVVRTRLPRRVMGGDEVDVVSSVCDNEEVNRQWESLSAHFDDPNQRSVLLREIVQLWVNARGFSLAASWLEQYKAAKHCLLQKKKSLRKFLRKEDIKN